MGIFTKLLDIIEVCIVGFFKLMFILIIAGTIMSLIGACYAWSNTIYN